MKKGKSSNMFIQLRFILGQNCTKDLRLNLRKACQRMEGKEFSTRNGTDENKQASVRKRMDKNQGGID